VPGHDQQRKPVALRTGWDEVDQSRSGEKREDDDADEGPAAPVELPVGRRGMYRFVIVPAIGRSVSSPFAVRVSVDRRWIVDVAAVIARAHYRFVSGAQ